MPNSLSERSFTAINLRDHLIFFSSTGHQIIIFQFIFHQLRARARSSGQCSAGWYSHSPPIFHDPTPVSANSWQEYFLRGLRSFPSFSHGYLCMWNGRYDYYTENLRIILNCFVDVVNQVTYINTFMCKISNWCSTYCFDVMLVYICILTLFSP